MLGLLICNGPQRHGLVLYARELCQPGSHLRLSRRYGVDLGSSITGPLLDLTLCDYLFAFSRE